MNCTTQINTTISIGTTLKTPCVWEGHLIFFRYIYSFVKCIITISHHLSNALNEGLNFQDVVASAGLFFFLGTAERAMKHGRSSGYIRNYSQKECLPHMQNKEPNTTKTTQHKQTKQTNPTRNGTCSRQSEKGETVRHPKRPQ